MRKQLPFRLHSLASILLINLLIALGAVLDTPSRVLFGLVGAELFPPPPLKRRPLLNFLDGICGQGQSSGLGNQVDYFVTAKGRGLGAVSHFQGFGFLAAGRRLGCIS